jgi:quinol monooxygenase YgiN
MKSKVLIALAAVLLVSAGYLITSTPAQASNTASAEIKKGYTVVCIVEAKSGKEAELKELLLSIVEPSRNEKTCLEYRLHQDLNNPAQFVLYENWESMQAHQQQFEKPYIKDLITKLGDLLAKPYICSTAEQIA